MTTGPDERTALEASVDEAEARWLESWVAGPTAQAWTSLPPQVGDAAPDFELPDETDTPRHIAEAWSERPALIIFWRHFGCGCGVDRAARLQEEMPGYEEAGLEVLVIGQGDAIRAAAYKEEYGIPTRVLVDGTLDAYRAYGLVEGDVSQLLFDAPESMWSHSREVGLDFIAARREMGRPLVDSPWMLPGEFVIDTGGIIRHTHRYQHCVDFPDARVLQAAGKLARQARSAG
jgi:peroxiredoxin